MAYDLSVIDRYEIKYRRDLTSIYVDIVDKLDNSVKDTTEFSNAGTAGPIPEEVSLFAQGRLNAFITGADVPLGGGGVSSSAFSSAINLSSSKVMTPQVVSGIIPFTVTGTPALGSQVTVNLQADGSSLPTFTGMYESTGSSGYDNRAGVINQITFYWDGFYYWYFIQQRVGDAGTDLVLPINLNSIIANATPTIASLTFSEALDQAATLRTSDFAISGKTISAVAFASSTQINITVSVAFVNGDTPTVTYTKPATAINQIKDLVGNAALTFGPSSIVNNVGSTKKVVRLNAVSVGMIESGDPAVGYTYTTSDNTIARYANTSNLSMPASTAGFVEATLSGLVNGPTQILGLNSVNNGTTFSAVTNRYMVYNTAGTYKVGTNGTGIITPNGTIPSYANNDVVKLDRDGAGAVTAYVNGVLLHTWTGTSTEVLYPAIFKASSTGQQSHGTLKVSNSFV